MNADASSVQTPPCVQPTLTFTHGLLAGQLSLIALAIAFIRYVVFEDPSKPVDSSGPSAPRSFEALEQKGKKRRRRQDSSASAAAAHHRRAPSTDNHILAGLGYDISTHASESTDWLNVIMAQVIEAYREAVHTTLTPSTGAKGLIEEILNFHRPKEEGFVTIDDIGVNEVDLGQDFPVVSNAKVRPSEDGGRVIDVDYNDRVTIGVDTRVVINVPRPRFAILPIRLGLTLIKFSATIAIEVPALTPEMPPSALVSLHPDFTLTMRTTSLIGSRAKLQDIPKIEQLIMARVRGWMVDHIVWPHKLAIPLPKVLAPRLNDDEPLVEGHDYDWVDESKQSEPMPTSINGEGPIEAGSDEEEDAELGGAIRPRSPRMQQQTDPTRGGSDGSSGGRLYPPPTRRQSSGGSSSASSGAGANENKFDGQSQTSALPRMPGGLSRTSTTDLRARKVDATVRRPPMQPSSVSHR